MLTNAPPPAHSRSPERQLIGVDLGGTTIKLVRCTLQGEPLAELVVPTPAPALPGAVTMAMVEAIERLDPERQADRVGVGHPGPSDRGGPGGPHRHQPGRLAGGPPG